MDAYVAYVSCPRKVDAYVAFVSSYAREMGALGPRIRRLLA